MTHPGTNGPLAATARNVSRRYRDSIALDQVSVAFEQNMIHGLLGRNGAGKTSLMSVLTGQDWPTEGEVTVFGQRPMKTSRCCPGSASSGRISGTSTTPWPATRSARRPTRSRSGTGSWRTG